MASILSLFRQGLDTVKSNVSGNPFLVGLGKRVQQRAKEIPGEIGTIPDIIAAFQSGGGEPFREKLQSAPPSPRITDLLKAYEPYTPKTQAGKLAGKAGSLLSAFVTPDPSNEVKLPLAVLGVGAGKLAGKLRANKFAKYAPDIQKGVEDLVSMSLKKPSEQMDAIRTVETTLDNLGLNSRELKKLSIYAPDEWTRSVKSFFDDALYQVAHPEFDMGLSVRALKRNAEEAGAKIASRVGPQIERKLPEAQAPVKQGTFQSLLKTKPSEPKMASLPGEFPQITPSNVETPKVSSNPIIQQFIKKPTFYNIERVGATKEGKDLIKQAVSDVTPQIEEVVGKKLSHQEVIDTAEKTASYLNRTIGKEETEKMGAMALNLRNKLAQVAENGKVDQEFVDLLIKDKAYSANLARLLGQRRIISDPTKGELINKIVEDVLKRVKDTDEVLKAAKGVDFNDANQATNFYRTYIKPDAWEKLDALRYNSMLSSPLTHIYNAFSNLTGGLVVAPAEKLVTGAVDFLATKGQNLISDFTKGKLSRRTQEHFAGEAGAYTQAFIKSTGDAARRFGDVMARAKLSDVQELHNIPLTKPGTGWRLFENFVTFFTRALQASDEFFQTMIESGSKAGLEYRKGKGVDVGNISIKAFLEGRKRLFNEELGKNPSKLLNALDTFANSIMQWRKNDNPIVSTIAKYSFPFLRVPTNVLKASLEYSPAGVTTLWGSPDKVEQVSKAIMGSLVGIATATLLSSDRLTWSEPVDPKSRNAFRDAGYQPYSVKIGDKWVNYSKLHPVLAFNIGLVAALQDQQKQAKLDDSQVETVLNGLAKWFNLFADMSFVKNIGEIVSAAKGSSEDIGKFVSGYPQQWLPFRALLGYINNIVDPYQRQQDPTGSKLDKTLQQIASQIPGLSQKVPARMNAKGEPIEKPNRFLNIFSPAKISTEKPESVDYFKYFTTAKRAYENLKQLPKDEANAKADQIYEANPQLYSALEKLVKADKLKMTGREEKVRSLDVSDGARSRAVIRELDSLKSKEEKNALIDRYTELGIVTDDVYDQLYEHYKGKKPEKIEEPQGETDAGGILSVFAPPG